MDSACSVEDVGEGHPGEKSRTVGRGSASPGTSGAGEGEPAAKHLSLEDFRTLLKLLKIKLPENVLNDDVISKSRKRKLSRNADVIVQKVKNAELQMVLKPRLQCRTVKSAWIKNPKNNVREITEMIFFEKCVNKRKALKQRWETILLNKHNGSKTKDMKHGAGEKCKNYKKTRSGNNENQRTEMKCLQFFLREKHLLRVHYRREHAVEFGFLSGRMDFLIKTKGSRPGTSEYTILECKGTTKDLNHMHHKSVEGQGHVAKLNSNNRYYYQTQAYLYILQKTHGPGASVRAVMVFRKYQKHEDWDDDYEEDTDEEDEEEKDDDDDQDEKYQVYEDNQEELKGEFCYNYVSEDMKKFKKLNTYCSKKALPLYLAVLNKLFEKVRKTDTEIMRPCEQFIFL